MYGARQRQINPGKRASRSCAGLIFSVGIATRATRGNYGYFDAVVLFSTLTTCTRRFNSASGWFGSFSLLLP